MMGRRRFSKFTLVTIPVFWLLNGGFNFKGIGGKGMAEPRSFNLNL